MISETDLYNDVSSILPVSKLMTDGIIGSRFIFQFDYLGFDITCSTKTTFTKEYLRVTLETNRENINFTVSILSDFWAELDRFMSEIVKKGSIER